MLLIYCQENGACTVMIVCFLEIL